MSKLIHFALASALALSLAAGGASAADKPAAKPAAAAASAPYKWPGLPPGAVEQFAAMRDGTRLAANVFKPAGPGPWPVVMTRTPYLKDGRIKCEIALAKGKKLHDKRESERARTAEDEARAAVRKESARIENDVLPLLKRLGID